jgi:hypothetical protein
MGVSALNVLESIIALQASYLIIAEVQLPIFHPFPFLEPRIFQLK